MLDLCLWWFDFDFFLIDLEIKHSRCLLFDCFLGTLLLFVRALELSAYLCLCFGIGIRNLSPNLSLDVHFSFLLINLLLMYLFSHSSIANLYFNKMASVEIGS
jgi:hypothetical protein